MFKGEHEDFNVRPSNTPNKEKSQVNMQHRDADSVMQVHTKGSRILPGKSKFGTKPEAAAAVTKLCWVLDF